MNVAGLREAEIELPNGIKIRVPATNAEALRSAILAGHDALQFFNQIAADISKIG